MKFAITVPAIVLLIAVGSAFAQNIGSVNTVESETSPTVMTPPTPLAQYRADHIAITTDDYEGTIAWYRKHLGMEVTETWEIDLYPGKKFAYIENDMNGYSIEVIYTPEFFQEEEVANEIDAALSDRGISHVAFLVADVDAVYGYFVEAGVEILLPPYSSPEADRRLIFVRDNSGNVVEFLTPLSVYR